MTISSRLDVHPRSGLYYFKTEETYKQGKKPQGKVQLAGVQILVETKTDPKYLGGAEYQALRLTSPTHNILCAPPHVQAPAQAGGWLCGHHRRGCCLRAGRCHVHWLLCLLAC
eukprot:COSAG01_NODE_5278_length_4363_cov_175.868433_3_plen_113_part_00